MYARLRVDLMPDPTYHHPPNSTIYPAGTLACYGSPPDFDGYLYQVRIVHEPDRGWHSIAAHFLVPLHPLELLALEAE